MKTYKTHPNLAALGAEKALVLLAKKLDPQLMQLAAAGSGAGGVGSGSGGTGRGDGRDGFEGMVLEGFVPLSVHAEKREIRN